MENKYYTPELEEFHLGFEYEEKLQTKDEWVKRTLEDVDDFKRMEVNTIDSHRRVKYLGREDIESLGFEKTSNNIFANNEVEIELLANNIVVIDRYYVISERLFKGKVKNKSELKRLMKQLGI